jgi:ankyrin repeat protein
MGSYSSSLALSQYTADDWMRAFTWRFFDVDSSTLQDTDAPVGLAQSLLALERNEHRLASGRLDNGNTLLHLFAATRIALWSQDKPRSMDYHHSILGPLVAALPMQLNATNSAARAPLHSAAFNLNTPMARSLLLAGALVDPLDGTGQSPLHDAARVGCLAICDLLLARGANPSLRDKQGLAPWELARQFNQPATQQLLLSAHERVELGQINSASVGTSRLRI